MLIFDLKQHIERGDERSCKPQSRAGAFHYWEFYP